MCIRACCFFIPLKWGCVSASVIEFIMVILEGFLYFTFGSNANEDEKAVWIVEICNLQICSILLLFGSLKDERIYIILHCIFIAIMLLAEVVLQIFAFKFSYLRHSPDWLIAYDVLYHSFLLYMIFVCCAYAKELRDKNYSDTGGITIHRNRHHRQMSSAISSEIYGM